MRRVLLVDDEVIHLRATFATLLSAGYAVITASCAERALELVNNGEFDVALVDLMMPRMNGIELIRQLHALAPGLKVVLTSTFPLSVGQIHRLGIDPVDFVPKPASAEQLTAVLGGPGGSPVATPLPPLPESAASARR